MGRPSLSYGFYTALVIFIFAVTITAAVFGRRMARWAFHQIMVRVYGFLVTRVPALRGDWVIQIDEVHREQLGSARAGVDRIETRAIQIEQVCRAVTTGLDRLEKRLDRLECDVLVQLANSSEAQHRNSTEISVGSKRLFTELAAVNSRTTQVEGLLRTTLARQSPSVAEAFLSASEEELVRVAESLAVLRPLVPYPEWRFDADWHNPDLSFRIRQRLWQHFADHDCEATVVLPWHGGTRLCMHLNNDLSRQIFIAGCIDPNEFTFLDRFIAPGMTFVDVGANEGIYSIFAASRVGASGVVWAFEPSEREQDRLRRNMEYNALNIQIFAAGLSDSDRHADLKVAESRYAGLNTMGKIPYEGVNIARTERVQLLRLDDVIARNALSRIDMIKIDIEGGELAMLRGAVETLRRYRPIVMFELLRPALASQDASPEEVIEFLQGQGYALYLFDPSTGFPALTNTVGWSGLGTGENIIGVPEEVSLPAAVFTYRPADSASPRTLVT